VAGRGFRRLAAAAAVGFLVLLVVTSAEAIGGPPSGTPILRSLPPHAAGAQGPAQEKGREASSLTGCEQQLQPSRRPGVPTVAIVGASFTAGVGAEDPAGSWAVLLARQLRWNAFVYGVPGAGYVHPGPSRKGPVAAEITRAFRLLANDCVLDANANALINQSGHCIQTCLTVRAEIILFFQIENQILVRSGGNFPVATLQSFGVTRVTSGIATTVGEAVSASGQIRTL